MFRPLVVLVSLAALVGCVTTPAVDGTAPSGKPLPRTGRANYTLPIPGGWEELARERIASMVGDEGTALRKAGVLEVPDYFRASIVVTGVQPASELPTDAAQCAKTAGVVGAAVNATVESSRIVSIPAAPRTCQMSVVGTDNAHRRARATLVGTEGKQFVITCNYDARDSEALEACEEVLGGFAFASEARSP